MSREEWTAMDWGRAATRIPGWMWASGMEAAHPDGSTGLIVTSQGVGMWTVLRLRGPGMMSRFSSLRGYFPHCDDPSGATDGCLMRLLGDGWTFSNAGEDGWVAMRHFPTVVGRGSTLGRACIAAAEALGRWPGGTP